MTDALADDEVNVVMSTADDRNDVGKKIYALSIHQPAHHNYCDCKFKGEGDKGKRKGERNQDSASTNLFAQRTTGHYKM